jgi:hypothetical protein
MELVRVQFFGQAASNPGTPASVCNEMLCYNPSTSIPATVVMATARSRFDVTSATTHPIDFSPYVMCVYYMCVYEREDERQRERESKG